MSLINIKNERKVIDGFIVLVVTASSYSAGFIQTLNLGAVSSIVYIPVGFILFLTFMHLVLRKSRKFDEREHKNTYELVKSVIFAGTVLFSFRTGKSTVENIIPTDMISAGLAIVFLSVCLYFMAYRANMN